MTLHQKNNRVLIVGAGPTGLTLANLLWQQGYPCDVIEKRDTPSLLNKAIVMSPASLEQLKMIDCHEAVLQDAQRISDLTMYWEHKRLCRIHYRRLNRAYNTFIHIRQPLLEKVLSQKLQKQGGHITRGCALIDLKQQQDNVSVELSSQNKTQQRYYDYVIGCDGGQSSVRTLSDMRCKSYLYNTYFIVGDVTLDWDHTKCDEQHYFMSPRGYLFIVPGPMGQHRIVGSFHGSCDRRIPSQQELMALLDERGPGSITIKQVHWSASAPFYHQLAEKAFNHRVVLAGDAYHLFSPVGGINMNLGIEDTNFIAQAFKPNQESLIESGLKAYQTVRQVQLLRLQKQTQIITDLITQKSYHAIADCFTPKMSNRKFMTKDLPQMMYGVGALPNCYMRGISL